MMNWLRGIGNWFRQMFAQDPVAKAEAKAINVRAKAEAYATRLDAENRHTEALAQAKARSGFMVYIWRWLDKLHEISKSRAEAKTARIEVKAKAFAEKYERKKLADAQAAAIVQEAKAAKWHEIGKAASRIIRRRRLRARFRLIWRRTKRKLKSGSGWFKNFFSGLTWKVSFLLTSGFFALTVYGATRNHQWLVALGPLGFTWSLAGRVIFKKGYYARLSQALLVIPTIVWVTSFAVIWLKG